MHLCISFCQVHLLFSNLNGILFFLGLLNFHEVSDICELMCTAIQSRQLTLSTKPAGNFFKILQLFISVLKPTIKDAFKEPTQSQFQIIYYKVTSVFFKLFLNNSAFISP